MTTENTIAVAVQEEQYAFEGVILDEKEPIRLTPDLIREKSAALTRLEIVDIFDEKGFKAVKDAKNKAVKTRTAIEKIEKDVLGTLKENYEKDKKRVITYTAELYAACREVEGILNGKILAIENAKSEAARKLEEERKARTEGREQRLYDAGMSWNGKYFTGYGVQYTKEYVHGLDDQVFEALATELEAKQLPGSNEPNITIPAPEAPYVGSASSGKNAAIPLNPDATIYKREIPEMGIALFITQGQRDIPADHVIISNDEINKSGYFIHLVK